MIILLLLFLLIPFNVFAIDKDLSGTNSYKVKIYDTVGNGIAGLDVTTPFADFVVKIQCGNASVVTMDETTDTVVDEGGGYYYITTNDTITYANEDECLTWVEGEGDYLNLIAKVPVKFKAGSANYVLTTAQGEPSGQGTCSAVSTSPIADIKCTKKFWRNKITQTNAMTAVRNDGDTQNDEISCVSDDDTTFTRGEFKSGIGACP